MKKETISFVLYTLLALSCATLTIINDDVFISGVYSFSTAVWGLLAGMELKELLTER